MRHYLASTDNTVRNGEPSRTCGGSSKTGAPFPTATSGCNGDLKVNVKGRARRKRSGIFLTGQPIPISSIRRAGL